MDDLDSLYQQVILDHSRNPRFLIQDTDAMSDYNHHKCYNPLCGDSIEVYLKSDGNQIESLKITGQGCAISMATASLMAEFCQAKSIKAVKKVFAWFQAMITDQETDESLVESMDVAKLRVLFGVKQFPMRVKCATCAWHALMAAFEAQEGGKVKQVISTEE